MSEPTKFLLGEEQIPTHWVNLLPDLPGEPLPPLSPATGQPAGPDDLTPIFPMGLIAQEVCAEPEVEIPEAVREAYGLWRPTPLFRARRLEQALGTPAKIFYKYEGTSPAGSHKPNTAVPQAYENAQAGIRKLATETGAGQWGSSLAFACSLFGLELRGLHGRLELRPEALPALDDGDVGRDRAPLAVGPHAVRPRAGRAPDRLARDRDLRGGRGRRAGPGLQLLARLGAQPRAAAPDGDRAGGDAADGAGRRGAGRDRRLRRRRLELRRARVPVPARRQPARASSPPSRPRARRSRAALPLRLRRHRRADAADADVHARPRLRAAARARGRAALPRRRADALRRW